MVPAPPTAAGAARGGRARGDARVGEDLAALLGELVLDQHLVAGGDDLAHRGEVALAAGGGVADQRPHEPEDRAEERPSRARACSASAVGVEEREDQADEQAEPQPDSRPPSATRPRVSRAGDPLDLLEVGADDHAVLDRELVVGEEVDGVLRLVVLVEDPERHGVLQGQAVRDSPRRAPDRFGCRRHAPSSHPPGAGRDRQALSL